MKSWARWDLALRLLAAGVLCGSFLAETGVGLALVCAGTLVGAVVAAVDHAEVVAHRVGEPFGTLVLALAITVIEVALIVSMMLAGGDDKESLPSDTIYSAVMIITTGVVGLGSALASIGLATKDVVLLALTFLVCTITLGTGRTNVMRGTSHLVLFAAFLFLVLVP